MSEISIVRKILQSASDLSSDQRHRLLLRTILDNSPDCIYVKDEQLRIVLSNKAHVAVLGCLKEDDVIGRTDADFLFSQQGTTQAQEYEKRILETGTGVYGLEEQIEIHGGHRIWFSTTKVALLDERGVPCGIVGISRDITAHKHMEINLTESERRHRTLFEQLPVGVALLEHGTYSVIDCNEKAHVQLGHARDEFLGMTISDYVHLEDIERYEEVRTGLDQGERVRMELRHQTKSGETRFVTANFCEVDLEGQSVVLAIHHDTTDLAELRDQLSQSQKMEAVGQLAGGIAHDFNNMMQVILGHCELALAGPQDTERTVKSLNTIAQAGERAASLTRQLLAFSRKQVLRPQLVDVRALLERLQAMVSRLLGDHISLRFESKEGVAPIFIDPIQLDMVLMNLLVNARDAMPVGGIATVSAENAILEGSDAAEHLGLEPGNYVMISVADTGVGMDSGTLSRVFEPFFTTKGMDRGSGLGLSTAYGIIEQSAGTISVSSELGRGTTFRIYLPADTETGHPTAVAASESSYVQGTETILVIEDEGLVRGFTCAALMEMGYTVLSAGSGEEALQVSRAHPETFDLVVLDIVIPGPTGVELRVGLAEHQSDLKVLYVSGYAEKSIIDPIAGERQYRFLAKPFTALDLGGRIREMLDDPPGIVGPAGAPRPDAVRGGSR